MAQHKTCEADIDYTALNGGSEFRRMHRLPCFIKNGEKPDQRVSCEHFTAPTAAEIATHKRWGEDREKMLMKALLGIAPWRAQHQGCAHSETVKCPVCSGQLHLSIAAHNGHVRGHCDSARCVSWAE